MAEWRVCAGELFPLSWVDRLHRIPQSADRRPPPRPPPATSGAVGSPSSSSGAASPRGKPSVSCTGTRCAPPTLAAPTQEAAKRLPSTLTGVRCWRACGGGCRHRWLVLLDTAAFVPHHVLNLTEARPDFAVM